jgi:CHAD domain-containing protein
LGRVLRFSWKKYRSRATEAAEDPGSVEKLHRMRISGKRLRDIMELCLPFAGGKFRRAFGDVKETVSLMGKIHDLDDAAKILRGYGELDGIEDIAGFVCARRKVLSAEFGKTRKKLESKNFAKLIEI